MNSIKVFVEIGKKRVFVGAIDWPGWYRSGRDEKTALQALIDYGPRYAQVLRSKEIEFQVPLDASDLIVTERHAAHLRWASKNDAWHVCSFHSQNAWQ